MRMLLDTNVISEAQKLKPDPRVSTFLDNLDPNNSFLSVMTIGEITYGIERMPHGKPRIARSDWLNEVLTDFAGRILPIDQECIQVWAEVAARLHSTGNNIEQADSLIAATAIRHGMHLATRNERDFDMTGVMLINPWN